MLAVDVIGWGMLLTRCDWLGHDDAANTLTLLVMLRLLISATY